jgi:excisionase family DNA binding protein
MTLREACEYLKVSASFVRKLVRTGMIPFSRVGNKMLRFRRTDLDQWLKGRCVGTPRTMPV